jgi:formylglycine-generating enzyme required for sulfatase activity
VPGGTFYRSYDGVTFTNQGYPATVSDFRLDTYEITVGRFRAFVAAYSQSMIPAGAGKNPNYANDSGWDTAWNTNLPANATALTTAVQCSAVIYGSWTTRAGTGESRPINCVNWYEAYAFCAWDGGRLPTEAEWNYAAAGGSEQRQYPWGAAALDCPHANFGGANFPGTACNSNGPHRVGTTSPLGDGKWGHADLTGNLGEWVLDRLKSPYTMPCVDCAYIASDTQAPMRGIRGGSFFDTGAYMLASYRYGDNPLSARYAKFGFRCARAK